MSLIYTFYCTSNFIIKYHHYYKIYKIVIGSNNNRYITEYKSINIKI